VTFEVRWRARIIDRGAGRAAGRFSRTVDELAATRQIGDPAYDLDPDRTFVTFRFQVEHDGYVAAAVDVARSALAAALAAARVGTPYPPVGHTIAHVSVLLETHPLSVKPVAA
jgi:hypothetical protein